MVRPVRRRNRTPHDPPGGVEGRSSARTFVCQEGCGSIAVLVATTGRADRAVDAPAAGAHEQHGERNVGLAEGKKLVEASDCMRCHGWERTYVGPSFVNIAVEYHARSDAQQYLAGKIRGGSVGVWGNVIMPRHPQISEEDALQMARWVLSAEPSGK